MSQDDDHPNLGAPGKPLQAWVKLRDGNSTPYPLPQTKWDNCWDLRGELGDRTPTDEELARWELTRREYEHFLDRHVAAQASLLESRLPAGSGLETPSC